MNPNGLIILIVITVLILGNSNSQIEQYIQSLEAQIEECQK